MSARTRAALLLALGMLNLLGVALDSSTLKGVAMATAASPAPKVFTTVDGLETFSSRFTVSWDEAGERRELEVTPEHYEKIRGPYNRRNVYGAVLAYGPVLRTNPTTRPAFESIVQHAMCGDAPVLRELGIDPDAASNVRVTVQPREGSHPRLPLALEAPCSP